jgi:hypothetical protein
MINGLERMRKEVVVRYFKVLSQHYGGNEEVCKLHQTEYLWVVFRLQIFYSIITAVYIL